MTVAQGTSLPECWGHRGASAAFPENTLASFEAAIRDGSEGIESDVHVSLDNVVIMFHDPSLDRTTNMKGLIREQNWYGPNGMQHARTKKEPIQAIPTFKETVALLMKENNQKIKFDVDVKIFNDAERLFSLMHAAISAHDGWETLLAPRIVLGLWHPRFLEPAKRLLPYCTRSHIGSSPYIARSFFWADCEAFSMSFGALATYEGERFRNECKDAGKKIMVWTVNDPKQMMEAVRWQVHAIITDVPKTYLDLRGTLQENYETTDAEHGRSFLWTSYKYWTPYQLFYWRMQWTYLESVGGPFVAP